MAFATFSGPCALTNLAIQMNHFRTVVTRRIIVECSVPSVLPHTA